MPFICIECCKDVNIKQLIDINGFLEKCSICGSDNKCINSENNNFIQLIKAITRFHYSEWDYNHHWGGDSYESLFYGKENIFFHEENAKNKDDYMDLISILVSEPYYEDYDKGVTLYGGYDEHGQQNGLLRAIKSDYDRHLLKIEKRLQTENYFLVENDLKDVITKYKGISDSIVKSGTVFYRARIGYSKCEKTYDMGFEMELHYEPYRDKDISAPPPQKSSSGRVNRGGVSFLYTATDKYTAVAEVRPHPADQVSIGRFSLLEDVNVFDLSNSQILNFYLSDKSLEDYYQLNTLSYFIHKTIPPSERHYYSMTQLIADCIRMLGYDGILFSSTVGEGKNLVLFNENLMTYQDQESEVIEIKSLHYNYHSLPIITDSDILIDNKDV